METVRRAYAQYVVPAECREAFAKEDHRHNNQVGLLLSIAIILLVALALIIRRVDIPEEIAAILNSWPLVPILAAGSALSLVAVVTLVGLRQRDRIDAPLSSITVLAYACLMVVMLIYQSHLEVPAFGVKNINIVALAMIILALMLRFPLRVTLVLETGALAIMLVSLFQDRPYISNFYPSLVDIVAVYVLVMVAATRSWRGRIHHFAGARRLSNMVNLDSLTQVQNRRGFDETLPGLWKRMLDAELPLSLLMIDVDFFKKYNDAYGHQAGDECLKQVAEALAASVRARDFVGRYGGEEFVVLLPGAGLEAAQRVGGRMAQDMAARAIPHSGNTVSPYVTFSVGCACCRPGLTCESPQALVGMADEALYLAKDQGRARLVPHPNSAP